ncbi:formylglycine-generating enzyme family protein [bacterium]|nr:formylglycine-generating enzyme family protein [bacterium]
MTNSISAKSLVFVFAFATLAIAPLLAGCEDSTFGVATPDESGNYEPESAKPEEESEEETESSLVDAPELSIDDPLGNASPTDDDTADDDQADDPADGGGDNDDDAGDDVFPGSPGDDNNNKQSALSEFRALCSFEMHAREITPFTPTPAQAAEACNMAFVPEGPAFVGCDPNTPDPFGEACRADQLPFHEVRLSAFVIDRVEVSFGEYNACVDAGACEASGFANDPVYDQAHLPVVGVTWFDADAYCGWRGKRLPTEAEWEKAARGPDGRVYPWGNQWQPERTNWDENGYYDGFASPAPVVSFTDVRTPYGAVNMTGNVWEWVSDWYDANYYSVSPVNDPQGPATGASRLLKGGAWKYDFYDTRLRTSFRNVQPPHGRSNHAGFRCAMSW